LIFELVAYKLLILRDTFIKSEFIPYSVNTI
jgi:hypothetical protein